MGKKLLHLLQQRVVKGVLGIFVLLCPAIMNAQFSGYYDPSGWTFSNVPAATAGSVNTSSAPTSISLTSGNASAAGSALYTITIPSNGTVSFNWSYSTIDGANYDYPQYSINGGTAIIMPGYSTSGSATQSGTASIPVLAGQTFSLIMYTTDGAFGAATTVFSSFSAPLSLMCSGTPSGGTASVTPALSGTSSSISLSTSGATLASGITYQWQISADGISGWTNISGAITSTSSTTAPATLGTTTYYRLAITCTGSGITSYSSVASHTTVIVYCTPTATYPGTNNTTFVGTTGGVTNFSNTTGEGVSGMGYSNYRSTHSVSQVQGMSINFTLNSVSTGSTCFARVWVDWNKNGVFTDPGEEVYTNVTSAGYVFTGSITVPLTAVPGSTVMRTRTMWSGESASTLLPCGNIGWGEAEDYEFVVIAALPCTGTPVGGSALATPSSGGTASSFSLNASGTSIASDYLFQWQSSSDGVSGWTDIAGATTMDYIATSSLTPGTTYYRLRITCPTSSATSYSSVTSFLAMNIVCGGDGTTSTHNVTFHVQNTNSYPISLNSISARLSAYSGGGTRSFKLLYHPTAIYGSGSVYPGPIGTGVGGWENATDPVSVTIPATPLATPVEIISGFELIIPAGATYTLCLATTMNSFMVYSVSGLMETSSGGVKIITGTNIGYAGDENIFTSSGTPSYTYWGFVGCLGFGVPCMPLANVTADVGAPPCEGGSISLTSSSDLAGSTFSWTGPGGFTSSDQNPVISGATIAMNGVYTVTATEPTNSCTRSATVNVTVNPNPNAFTVSPATSSICPGGSVALTASDGFVYGGFADNFNSFPFINFTASGTTLAVSNDATYHTEGASALKLVPANSATSYYSLNNNVDLSAFSSATVSFKHIAAFEGCCDQGFVEYSSNGGTTWTTFPNSSYTGTASTYASLQEFNKTSYTDWDAALTSSASVPNNSLWKTETFNIPAAALTSQFRVRFRITTDVSVIYYGWLIDELVIGNPNPVTYTWTPLTGTASGAHGETYTASPVPTTGSAGVANTTYTATATNAFGCTATSTAVVTVGPIPSGIIALPSSCTTASGSLNVSGLAPATAYQVEYTHLGTYTVSPVITSNSFGGVAVTGLSAGLYENIRVILVSNSCTSSVVYNMTISEPAPPAAVISAHTNPTLCGTNNGSITFGGLVSGTLYRINYELDGVAQPEVGPTAATTGGVLAWAGLAPGNYTNIRVKNPGGCVSAALSQLLTQPEAPAIVIESFTNPTSCTSTDGAIHFSGMDADGDYTIDYLKDGTVQNTFGTADASGEFSLTGLSGAAYTGIVVTNSFSCGSAPVSQTLTQPVQDALLITPTVALACSGEIHTITVTGGGVGATSAAISWSPVAGLYTDAAATIAYAGEDLTTVYAAPSSNTTYTATATASGCATTASAAINVSLAGNSAALATAATNGVDLNIACEEAGWTYYSDPSDPDNAFLFGINWGVGNDAAQAAALVTIQLDGGDLSVEDVGAAKSTYTMKRYWNVDLAGTTLVNPVSVRFFYDMAEKTAMDALATDFSILTGGAVEPATWFKTEGAAFDPAGTTVTPIQVEGAIALVDATGGTGVLNGVPYAQFDGIESFSGGTYATGVGEGAPLNSKLGTIEAVYQGDVNRVIWNTLSEELGDRFQLEKSLDGRSFHVLTKVDAKGEPSQYFYLDNQPVTGYNYYRVLMHNKNGSVEISKLVYVRVDKDMNNTLTVFPNPTDMDVTLRINGRVGNNAKIYITDVTGKVLEVINQVPSNEVKISLDRHAQGVYLIKYTDDDFTHTVKVTKQ